VQQTPGDRDERDDRGDRRDHSDDESRQRAVEEAESQHVHEARDGAERDVVRRQCPLTDTRTTAPRNAHVCEMTSVPRTDA
jgi:hypothetical protein